MATDTTNDYSSTRTEAAAAMTDAELVAMRTHLNAIFLGAEDTTGIASSHDEDAMSDIVFIEAEIKRRGIAP